MTFKAPNDMQVALDGGVRGRPPDRGNYTRSVPSAPVSESQPTSSEAHNRSNITFVTPVAHCFVYDVCKAFSDSGMKPFQKDGARGFPNWCGTLNVCDNCVTRWAVIAPDCTAIIYESNESSNVKITFNEFLQVTCRVATLYKVHGRRKGD